MRTTLRPPVWTETGQYPPKKERCELKSQQCWLESDACRPKILLCTLRSERCFAEVSWSHLQECLNLNLALCLLRSVWRGGTTLPSIHASASVLNESAQRPLERRRCFPGSAEVQLKSQEDKQRQLESESCLPEVGQQKAC